MGIESLIPQLKEMRRQFVMPAINRGDEVLCVDPGQRHFIGRVEKVNGDSCEIRDTTANRLDTSAYHKDDPRFLYSKNAQEKHWRWEYTQEYLLTQGYRRRVEYLESVVGALAKKAGVTWEPADVPQPTVVVAAPPDPEANKPQLGQFDIDFAERKYAGMDDDALRELLKKTPNASKVGLVKAKRETLVRKLIEAGTPV